MSTSAGTSRASLVRAATRLGQAVAAFVSSNGDQLELEPFHVEELRVAGERLLAVFAQAESAPDGAATTDARMCAAMALRALERVRIQDLDPDSRAELASGIGALHAALLAAPDDGITRGLLEGTPVGRELAALVFEHDPALLAPDAQVAYCQAAQRLESATHARLGAGLVAFAGSSPRHSQFWVEGEDIELTDVRASELASALTWSGNRARDAIETARTLSTDLGSAAEGAADGQMQPAAATVVADGAKLLTAGIDAAIAEARSSLPSAGDSEPDVSNHLWELTQTRDALVQQYDSAVTAYACNHTVADTRRKVRDTLARLDPAGFSARRARARDAESGVEFRALPNAMAMLTAVMPSEQASACFSAIDSVARDGSRSEAGLPIGVRRSDALYAFCVQPSAAVGTENSASGSAGFADGGDGASGAAGAGVASTPGGRRALAAHVDLVMTLDAFLGLSETPADCVGAGPIPASAAREMLAVAELVTFRRLLVDGSSGHVLDADAKRYRLTERERAFILLRDGTCRHPGCNQPARRCEVDHATPYGDGGSTSADNLGALCTRHHLEKTHAGWSIEDGAADGSCTFVSPLGRRYRHEPEAVLPWMTREETPPDDFEPC